MTFKIKTEMITKENVFKIALQIIPDLTKRNYKITDQLSKQDGSLNLPADCWYVIYSPVPVNNSACSTSRNLYLCIDKESGEIKK